MTTETLAPIYPSVTRDDVEAIIAANGEPAWLTERRRAAWSQYQSMDLPDPYDEEWRRTDVRALDLTRFRMGSGVAVTGVPSSRELAARGLVVTTLDDAAKNDAAAERYLYSAVPADEWKYLSLNAALWSGGVFVRVPDDVEIELPIQLAQSVSAGAAFPRTLIVAGRNARVAIIDEGVSAGADAAFVSGAVEIIAGDGAKVQYYNVNRYGDDVLNFTTVRAILGRDAEFTAFAAGIGSKLTKMRIDAEMPRPGATTQILGVTFGSGDQHFDYNTLQNHVGDHTISDLQFKSALKDSASLVWYGITRINPTAGGSEANQTSRNLLLSEHAKAAPIPVLEIEAHDVSKCSHGATAGPVEEGELFYLESRGIPRATAEHMLVEGFFADVIDRIPDAGLRDRVLDAVLEKAGGSMESLTFDEMVEA
jgi:Fe-S cluster assembly protein SufD